MRILASGALAGVLLTACTAVAQPKGEAGDKRIPPGVVQPGGGQPGVLQPGQPFQPGEFGDPQAMMEKMKAQMAKNLGLRVPPRGVKWGGAALEPAGDALLDQLNLPAGKGMIVTSVDADSAAGKAGLKTHDLVIKVNDKSVAGDAKEMVKALGKNDPETPVDLVVVRKGKEQTLKGVKLPEVALAPTGGFGIGEGPAFPAFPVGPGGGLKLPKIDPKIGGFGGFPFPPGGININGMKLQLTRDKDDFNSTYEKDKLKIAIKGKMDGKTAKVDEIAITEGDSTKKYEKVKDVPEAHRETVDRIIQVINGDLAAIAPLGGLPKFPGGVPNPRLPGGGDVPPPAEPGKDVK